MVPATTMHPAHSCCTVSFCFCCHTLYSIANIFSVTADFTLLLIYQTVQRQIAAYLVNGDLQWKEGGLTALSCWPVVFVEALG
jgi:hypothetical protein